MKDMRRKTREGKVSHGGLQRGEEDCSKAGDFGWD
jgi:hypothetical protein